MGTPIVQLLYLWQLYTTMDSGMKEASEGHWTSVLPYTS